MRKGFLNTVFQCIGLIVIVVSLVGYASEQAGAKGDVENVHTIYERLWYAEGYGYIIKFVKNKAFVYDVTADWCVLNHTLMLDLSELDFAKDISLTTPNTALLDWGAANKLVLRITDALPQHCKNALSNQNKTPFNATQLFAIYTQTYFELFAFSDPDHLKQKIAFWSSKIDKQTTEEELVEVINNFIASVDDGHAALWDKDGELLAFNDTELKRLNQRLELEQTKTINSAHTSYWRYKQYLLDGFESATKSYFLAQASPIKRYDKFIFAHLPNNLRYFKISEMSEYSELQSLSSDISVVDTVLSLILPSMRQSNGVVIDLRSNPGGYDLVSLQILSYFIDKKVVLAKKQAKYLAGYTPLNPVTAIPSDIKPYSGPIVVLTNQFTTSAAEIFLLGLKARGNTSFYGSRTDGAFSDSLVKQLPNGWYFSLSNEIYWDPQGNHYEMIGHPVSKFFEYLNTNDIEQGVDSALQAAITDLKK
ncbi:S41 family peptidase [Pseudoalteromonas sp. A25]|uniref:S41 family peptidase n=1 Tax=Pseudoalteromonas sp. A25 TaxID=116092 RepID=UPI001561FCE8|nr:S41 family peptidase [Pseudoalteromonas sp. A25]